MESLELKFFKEMYDESSTPQVLINSKKVISANKIALKLLRLHSLDDLQQLLPLLFSPEFQPDGTPSKEKRKSIIKQVLAKGSVQVEWEFTLPHRSSIITELTITALKHNNRPLFHVSVIDLSSRIAMEKALKESENKFRTFIEKSPTAIMIYQNMKWLYVNPTTTRLLGYTPEEMYTMDLVGFIHPDDRHMVLQRAQDRLQNQADVPNDYDIRVTTKAGKNLWANIHLELIDINTEQAILLSATDITARKIAEQKRAENEERIRRTRKLDALGQLSGGIAHNLNNILSTISGANELIRVATIQPKYTDIIDNSISHAKKIIKHLLDFSKQGKQISTTVDIHQIVTQTIELLDHALNKNITFQRITSSRHLFTEGDPSQIQSAILNLALNAVDAMPNGGTLLIETGLKQLTQEECDQCPDVTIAEGDYIDIRIKDNGVGMDSETLSHIFEPFFSRKPNGTGLGLPSAYGVAKDHGGGIRFWSTPGEGTIVSLLLPLTKNIAANIDASLLPSSPQKENQGQKTVLIVDDNIFLCRITGALLKKMGYLVLTAYSGKEALALFNNSENRIDLIVLDIVMPEMNGDEVFKAIRLIHASHPILIHSGYHKNADIDALLKMGNAGFIQKPYTYQELKEEIDRLLV